MSDAFDVFLCHNSADKGAVRELADLLVQCGLRPWLDERELIPGRTWQDGLEVAISSVRTVAVLVGRDGEGPWQKAEIGAALMLAVERGLPVIPVLLPGVSAKPQLPLFLRAFTWVDFRSGFDGAGLARLEWGIRGQKAGGAAAVATTPSPPIKPEPEPRLSFWQKHKEALERWALLIGILALVVGVTGDLLDLRGKWETFWHQDAEKQAAPSVVVPEKQFLRGELLDEEKGKPLAGVRVWLPEFRLEQTTDKMGLFEFELPVPANTFVKVRTELVGYEGRDLDPMVGPGQSTWLMTRLK